MILSIFALQLYMEAFRSREEALRFAGERGIETVEIFDSELKEIALHDYCKLVRKNGLSISTVIRMSRFPAKSDVIYASEMNMIRKLIEQVSEENIKMIMIVPTADDIRTPEDKRFMRDRIVQGFREITEYAKKYRVTILTENFSRKDYPFGTIEEMRDILDLVPDLKYNFDTGNFYFHGEDILEAYEVLKDRIINIHIKDWKNEEDGEFRISGLPAFTGTAIGSGILPMQQFLEKLINDNYTGQLVIEVNPVAQDPEIIEESAAFVKTQLRC